MSYNENLATQAFVNESIEKLIKPINNPDEALETGIYKVVEDNKLVGADNYILIVQEAENGQAHIKQTKLMADGALYSREFDIFEPPFPAFTQSTVSQNYMALFKIMVDSQFATIEDELEKQRIIPSIEGESIAMPDSADAQLRGLKVMGKTEQVKTNGYQLFDVKSMDFSSRNGVEVNKLDNGSIRLTKTKIGTFLYASSKILNLAEFIDKTLYISLYVTASAKVAEGKNGIAISYGNSTTGITKSIKNAIRDTTTTPTKLSLSITPTVADSENYDTIRIVLYENASNNLVGSVGDYVDFSDIMISTENVAFEPYTGGIPAPNVNYPQPLESIGDDGGVDVNVYGKNLTKLILKKYEYKGNTATVVSESALVLNGTATGEHSISMSTDMVLYAGTYTMSVYGLNKYSTTYDRVFLVGKDSEGNTVIPVNYVVSGSAKTFTLAETTSISGVSVVIKEGSTYNNTTVNIQIERGNIATEYEPFKPIQTLTSSTPNGLPGVPVSSDGNYTDASGQQWVCDEIDFNRGVYVQRVNEYVVTGNENWVVSTYQNSTDGRIRFDSSFAGLAAKATGDRCLCTHWVFNGISPRNVESVWVASNGLRILTNCFSTVDELKIALKAQYNSGTPVTVKYPIATPIETPLSAEEITAYKALRTHYPSTSIHNSKNAHMAVDYVADTKNYVDNQIKKEVAELTAAILTQ